MSVTPQPGPPWLVSLHGGHSSDYCDHARSSLADILTAAVTAGYRTFGVTEHVPRTDDRFLYANERALGWNAVTLENAFARYTEDVQRLAREFADRIVVLRAFESEVVPQARYVEETGANLDRKLPTGEHAFDYFVGSVHYVNEIQIDGDPEEFARAVDASGGPEALAIRYYGIVAAMIDAVRPDVVGHLDLVRKNVRRAGFDTRCVRTPQVRAAAERALDAVEAHGCILDVNTAGWRKGLPEPYPARWLAARAQARRIPFCFGDDSHAASDVGAGVARARDYLLALGVDRVTVLDRRSNAGRAPRRVVTI